MDDLVITTGKEIDEFKKLANPAMELFKGMIELGVPIKGIESKAS